MNFRILLLSIGIMMILLGHPFYYSIVGGGEGNARVMGSVAAKAGPNR